MRTILALAAVFVGCDGTVSYVCSDNVFSEVRYTIPVDCSQSRRVTALALKTMSDSGMWVRPNLKSIVLVVYDTPYWVDARAGREVGGMFTPGQIEVGSTYADLVHELFHAKDWLDLDVGRLLAPVHAGWDKDGRDALHYKWRASLAALDSWK